MKLQAITRINRGKNLEAIEPDQVFESREIFKDDHDAAVKRLIDSKAAKNYKKPEEVGSTEANSSGDAVSGLEKENAALKKEIKLLSKQIEDNEKLVENYEAENDSKQKRIAELEGYIKDLESKDAEISSGKKKGFFNRA